MRTSCGRAPTRRVVEGRFELEGERGRPDPGRAPHGRSRGRTSNGRMATAAALEEHGARAGRPPRPARAPVPAAAERPARGARPFRRHRPRPAARRSRAVDASCSAAWPSLGGDAGARAGRSTCCGSRSRSSSGRHIDGPDEDERLDAEESALADAVGHRLGGASRPLPSLTEEGGALDAVAAARPRSTAGPFASRGRTAPVAGRRAGRRRGASSGRTASASRRTPSGWSEIRLRRQLLADLRRKYGTARRGGPARHVGRRAGLRATRRASRLASLLEPRRAGRRAGARSRTGPSRRARRRRVGRTGPAAAAPRPGRGGPGAPARARHGRGPR